MDSDNDDNWSDSSAESPSQTRIATTQDETTTTEPGIPAGQYLDTSRFSPKIMGVIFEFCLEPWTYCSLSMEEAEEQDDERLKRRVLGPFFLGAVCATWRQIAWAHAPLWSRIHIDLASGLLLDASSDADVRKTSDYDTFFPPDSRRWAIHEQWVSRAGELPLSVHISHPNIPEDQSSTTTLEVLRVFLSRNSQRLSYLEMYGPEWFLFRMDELFTPFPKLDTLVVKCAEEPDPSWPEASREPRRESAHPWATPTHVTIIGIPLLSLAFTWTHVTHLTADSYNCKYPMDVISLAKNLSHCSFKTDQLVLRDDDVEPDSELDSSIRSLEFWQQHPPPNREPSDLEETLASNIFEQFTFPQLTSLRFGKHVVVPFHPLSDFIERSSCRLTSLAIVDSDFDGAELPELLDLCPELTELELSLCNESYEDKFLKILSLTTSPNTRPIQEPIQEWTPDTRPIQERTPNALPGTFLRTSTLSQDRLRAIVNELNEVFAPFLPEAEPRSRLGAPHFLPKLRSIKFKRGRFLPTQDSFWKRLPTIFGRATTDSYSSSYRRPLKFVHIDFGTFEGPRLEPSKRTIRILQRLESEGSQVSLGRYGVAMSFAQVLAERKKVTRMIKSKREQFSIQFTDVVDSD